MADFFVLRENAAGEKLKRTTSQRLFSAGAYCSVCYRIVQIVAPQVELEAPHLNEPLNATAAPAIGIVRQDFLEVLRRLNVTEFEIGDVLDEQQNVNPDCKTIVGRSQAVLRGDSTSVFRFCDACTRPVYCPRGELYVLEGTAQSAQVLEFDGTFAFREDLANAISRHLASCDFHLVRQEAEAHDGLPADLTAAPAGTTRNTWTAPNRKRKRTRGSRGKE